MTTYKNILVATDFSTPSRVALDHGKDLARSSGATLHVLHVIHDIPTYYGSEVGLAVANIAPSIEAAADRELDAAIGDSAARVNVRKAISRASNVADAINAYAAEIDADVIVVGTHGRGAVSRFLMGSVADRVIRSATRPVLSVRAGDGDVAPPPDASGEAQPALSAGA